MRCQPQILLQPAATGCPNQYHRLIAATIKMLTEVRIAGLPAGGFRGVAKVTGPSVNAGLAGGPGGLVGVGGVNEHTIAPRFGQRNDAQTEEATEKNIHPISVRVKRSN
jgi:hypothetical protein